MAVQLYPESLLAGQGEAEYHFHIEVVNSGILAMDAGEQGQARSTGSGCLFLTVRQVEAVVGKEWAQV